jgi:hypothetical protein
MLDTDDIFLHFLFVTKNQLRKNNFRNKYKEIFMTSKWEIAISKFPE